MSMRACICVCVDICMYMCANVCICRYCCNSPVALDGAVSMHVCIIYVCMCEVYVYFCKFMYMDRMLQHPSSIGWGSEYACMCVYAYICMYIEKLLPQEHAIVILILCVCVYIYIYIYVCVCVCVCVYVYTWICVFMHNMSDRTT